MCIYIYVFIYTYTYVYKCIYVYWMNKNANGNTGLANAFQIQNILLLNKIREYILAKEFILLENY